MFHVDEIHGILTNSNCLAATAELQKNGVAFFHTAFFAEVYDLKGL